MAHLQLEMEALQAVVEWQKKEIQAGSDALLSFAKENAHLKVQLEAEKELWGASAENKVSTCRTKLVLSASLQQAWGNLQSYTPLAFCKTNVV